MSATDAKTERFQMAVSANWIEKVDNWRYENRVPSRATAIRQLVDRALEKEMPAQAGNENGG